ncbi:MAG: YicC family protein [Desulfobacteraceae bacterium]|nr:YicC family protein [Desulfobacteraceae bacterium]
MVKSMTAYSAVEKTENGLAVNVEIRSYNNRHLDINLRIPQRYLAFEDRMKALISEKVARGRVEVRLVIKEDSDDAYEFEINEPKALAYHKTLVHLRDKFGIDTDISLDHMTGLGIIRPAEIKKDLDTSWPFLKECISEATDNLNNMRIKEGDFIAKDILGRIDYIEKSLDQIEKGSGGLLLHYQERLKERISALTRGVVETDPGRIEQEAAFLADRSDISEEIVRVRSHVKQYREIMNSKEPSGRKLNFLLQELNREFNTMGSKTGNTDVSHTIVEVKSELEKIREQVQNVE